MQLIAQQQSFEKLQQLATAVVNRLAAENAAACNCSPQPPQAPTSVSPQVQRKICTAPWRKHSGMCLRFFRERKTWQQARGICRRNGGFLTWMKNRTEHVQINDFLFRNNFLSKFGYFHLGLFREKEGGPLKWSGGVRSSYRGFPFVNRRKMHFSSAVGYFPFSGDSANFLAAFLCRRYWKRILRMRQLKDGGVKRKKRFSPTFVRSCDENIHC